ncbi:MAG: hypothetical protein QOF22_319 [Bradyrhizobium sp.]|nr:hypothetical protein [Bradyrhizobium sp.]
MISSASTIVVTALLCMGAVLIAVVFIEALILWRTSRRVSLMQERASHLQTLIEYVRGLAPASPLLGDNAPALSEEIADMAKSGTLPPGDATSSGLAINAETRTEALLQALEALARRANARRRLAAAGSPVYRRLTRKPVPPTAGSAPPLSKALTEPNEAAILAALTEKFYASASFKALGLALTFAVLLAGSGIVYLGAQSVNLRDGLNQTATDQEKRLTTAGYGLEKLINNQKDTIQDQNKQMGERFTLFQQHADVADAKITSSFQTFQTGSKELEEKAINAAVARIKAALETRAKELSAPVEQAANSASARISAIAQNLDTALTDSAKKRADLEAFGPDIERIRTLASTATQTQTVVAAMEANAATVAAAARDATASRDQAAQSGQGVKDLFAQIQSDLQARERDLGALQERINARSNDFGEIQRTLDGMKLALSQSNAADLTTRLNAAIASAETQATKAHDAADRATSSAALSDGKAKAIDQSAAKLDNAMKLIDQDRANATALLAKTRDELNARQRELGDIVDRVAAAKTALDQLQLPTNQDLERLRKLTEFEASAQAAATKAQEAQGLAIAAAGRSDEDQKHAVSAAGAARNDASAAATDATDAHAARVRVEQMLNDLSAAGGLQARVEKVEALTPDVANLKERVGKLEKPPTPTSPTAIAKPTK